MQLLFQKSCFLEAANFLENQYSAATVFSGELLHQRAAFSQHTFLGALICSYTSFPHMLFLFMADWRTPQIIYLNAMSYFLL